MAAKAVERAGDDGASAGGGGVCSVDPPDIEARIRHRFRVKNIDPP